MESSVGQVYSDEKTPEFKRNYQVFRFIGGNLISFFGDQIYLIALPLIVLALTGSPLSMGIVAALERLPIIIQPFTGVLADRFNRKRILMVCDLGRFVTIGLLGLLHMMNSLYIWEVYAGALLVGVLTQVYNTSQFASVPKLVQKKDLQLVNSINTGIFQTAVFIAPGLGGIIISIFNPGVGLLINSISFFIGFLIVLSLKIDSPDRNENTRGSKIFADIKEGFVFVLKQKPILYTNIAMLFSIFGTTLFLTMLVIHLKSSVELDTVHIGYLLSIGGVAAVGGALVTNLLKRYFSYRRILFLSGTIGGISIIVFSFSDTFMWLALMNAVGTISAAIMSPCIVTIRQTLSPDHLLGRVQATSRFMTWILMPVAALAAGIIAEQFGTEITILVGGIIATIASFIYLHPSLKKTNVILNNIEN
ncbi:Major Facilitator Superfamily protein [Virgibacillus subterraneus]|uniref:Major Facilitator Superfamily protein n=2 Tax=Virgibacillus TaxID=84406 RepID=A0A1H1DWB0_9BACI|nr:MULTISPECIES: MFS transporter [Virgibacillus]SDQ80196.1 Major Facilitator Superfamily protein [Virgibacillus salinus]SEQ88563.1 Major Facilitator Superfamily protein [Virgibacillus subterraneus]